MFNIISGIISNIILWFIQPIKAGISFIVTSQKASLGILVPLAK